MEERRIHLPPTSSSTITLALLTLSPPPPSISRPLSASPAYQSESAARSDSSHPSHRLHIYTTGGKHSSRLVLICTSTLHCAVLIIPFFALRQWVQIRQKNKKQNTKNAFEHELVRYNSHADIALSSFKHSCQMVAIDCFLRPPFISCSSGITCEQP